MRPIAEGPGGLPLRADLVAQQKRLRELEDRVRKMRQAPWPAPPAEDGEGEGWLLSYLDLLTLLLVMLVVMLAMSEPKRDVDATTPAPAVATAPAVSTAPAPPAAVAMLVGSTADLPPDPAPARALAAWSQLSTLLAPVPVTLPLFEPEAPLPPPPRAAALAVEMPYTPVPALVALAPPRPVTNAAIPPAPDSTHPASPSVAAETLPTSPASPTTAAAGLEPESAQGMPDLDLSLLGEGVDVIVRERSVSFRISNELLFDLGQVDLTARGIDVLQRVVHVVRDTTLPITVEGHTDPIPIRNDRFPSNWELSTFRATSVLRLLIDAGVDPQRLRAIGYADTRPIADNAGVEGRALNRRVELILEMPAEAEATGPGG